MVLRNSELSVAAAILSVMIDDNHNDEALFADLADGLSDDADTAAAAAAAIQPIRPALRDAGVYLLNEMVLRPRAGQERFCAALDPDNAVP